MTPTASMVKITSTISLYTINVEAKTIIITVATRGKILFDMPGIIGFSIFTSGPIPTSLYTPCFCPQTNTIYPIAIPTPAAKNPYCHPSFSPIAPQVKGARNAPMLIPI